MERQMTLTAMQALCGLTPALNAPDQRTDRAMGQSLLEMLRRLFK